MKTEAPTLGELLARRRPTTIPEVIALMRAIDEALPQADGVAWFNKLYLNVTESVGEAAGRAAFRGLPFLTRLDVAFANLFFDALDACTRDSAATPKAWVPLIESRGRRDVAPIQFALAGMNAHINRDLPVALVETWAELGHEPELESPEHSDFEQVNALLAQAETATKAWFETGFVGVVDRAFGNLDDVLAMWNVARARDAAWTNAQTLWAIRDRPALSSAFLLALDRMVGFAGRGLLIPVEPAARGPAGVVGRFRRLWRRIWRR